MTSRYELARQRRLDEVDRTLSGRKCIVHRGGMIYTSKDGEQLRIKEQTIVQKTLTLKFSNENPVASSPTDKLLKIIWRIAGYNCIEVKYRSHYRYPDDEFQSYSFDLFFQVGIGLPYKSGVELNPLMYKIEQEAADKLGCAMLVGHNHGEKSKTKQLTT
jgi:hypothetical protein